MKLQRNIGVACLFICTFAVAFSGLYAAAAAPKEADYNDHPKYNFHGETDKTDIFAIPLDESEETQDEELETLEEGYPPVKQK